MWYELIHAVVAPAVVFLASAAEAPVIPLPQAFDTGSFVSSQLLAQNFSTNPHLAQAQAPPAQPGQPAPELSVAIVNFKPCVNQGYHLTYRLIVRNRGVIPLFDIVTQDQYPIATTYRTGDRLPDEVNELTHIITWKEGFLAPGQFVSYTFTVRVDTAGGQMVNNVTVTARDALGQIVQASSDHRIPVGCRLPALAPASGQSAKQPAIICDPAEEGCQQILPNLGVNFQRAQQPAQQPIICGPGDPRGCAPNRPELGVRFREAIADIQPGDCRVLPDDVISTPDYQDALTRRAQPSAFYLAPLYDAGQNFRKLVLENAILGIGHLKKAQERLRPIHMQFYETQRRLIQRVLDGSLSPKEAQAQVGKDRPGFLDQVTRVQQQLRQEYVEIQNQRRGKFDPVAEKAITQAIESIRRACGGDPSNHAAVVALRQALVTVKQAYELSLDDQLQAYGKMQGQFANPDDPAIPPEARAGTFDNDLRAALSAFEAGNPVPLQALLNDLSAREQKGFNDVFTLTYVKQRNDDEAADNRIRLEQWQVALQGPKTAATECEAENVFAPDVERTWCESNNYFFPQNLVGAPNGVASQAKPEQVAPPDTAAITARGPQAVLQQRLIEGVACGGGPGDPWWADDCSCHCGNSVPAAGGTITTCQDAQGVTKPIVRHDNRVQDPHGDEQLSQEECLAEGAKHNDLFF